jgi:hypothetical protein
MLLFIAPYAFRLMDRSSPLVLLFLAIVLHFVEIQLNIELSRLAAVPYVLQLLFVKGIGGFRVIGLFFCGVIGLALGALWHEVTSREKWIIALGFILGAISLRLIAEWLYPPVIAGYDAVVGTARFLVMMLLSMALCRFRWFETIARPLGLIGKFSLFSFLMHRIILQLGFALLTFLHLRLSPEVTYFCLLICTMATILALCQMRMVLPSFDRGLKKIYL